MLDLHYGDGDDDDENICTFYLSMLLKLFVSLRKVWARSKHVVLLNKTELTRVDTDNNFVQCVTDW